MIWFRSLLCGTCIFLLVCESSSSTYTRTSTGDGESKRFRKEPPHNTLIGSEIEGLTTEKGGPHALTENYSNNDDESMVTCKQVGKTNAPSSDTSETSKKSGWGSVEVNPLVFVSAVYKGTFRVSIYKREKVTDESWVQYFYVPALILDPSTARCGYSSFNDRYEMTFAVIMWDNDYEEFVLDVLKQTLNVTSMPRTQIRILPIEEIRIATAVRNDAYEVYDKWISYASQPSLFSFRFLTVKSEKCEGIASRMKENPDDFANNLIVYYSLLTQRSSRSSLDIKAEHIKGGKLATSLQQKLPDKETVYMTSADAKEMTMEMATNVVAVQVRDQDFVSTDQALQISTLIESILKIIPQSSADFDSQMWDSVFWNDDNARPDKTTNELNELYGKMDSETQSRVRDYLSTDESKSGGGGINIADFGGVDAHGSGTDKRTSDNEREKSEKLLSESRKNSEWNGQKFIPKSLSLSRVNTAAFRSTTTIATTQVSVAKTASELSSRINVLDSASSIERIKRQRDEIMLLKSDLSKAKAEVIDLLQIRPGTIVLSFTRLIPPGWLLCDGQLFNTTEYPELNRVIGPRTPAFSGRFPLATIDGNRIGQTGGQDYIQLSIDQLPSHYFRVPGTGITEKMKWRWLWMDGGWTCDRQDNTCHANSKNWLYLDGPQNVERDSYGTDSVTNTLGSGAWINIVPSNMNVFYIIKT